MIDPVAAGSIRAVSRSQCVLLGGEFAQGASCRDADVEAAPVDGILASLPPLDVSAGLVVQVPAHRGDAVGQGQRHAGIVGPLSSFQAVRPATSVAGDRCEAAR